MALAPGSHLGPYEVIAQIGVGGMGEVYQAKDSRLKRDVALKVLPDSFAQDADRLARFQREAELLATLNHPNIAGIYGLEESNGVRALVLELVEGPTLADRLARGPIPIDEALLIAGQIADALEAAHEKGVIHRDLKPANIKVTPDDKVKVLDFGLAKMLENPAAPAALSMSPTLSVHATYAGVILGTAAYMSPEQARGKAVDKRTDIWAFGCVLFEMLTGAAPFGGDDVAEVIGAIIHKDLQWDRLPASTTTTIRTVLTRCLEKDPKKRVRDIGDVQLALDGAFESLTPSARPARPQVSARRFVSVAAIVALGIAAIIVVPLTTTRKPETPAIVTRFPIVLAEGLTFANNARNQLAISPDGGTIAFEANRQLYVRSMGDAEARPVPGTTAQNAAGPFFSPDGRWLGYLARADRTIKKVAMSGGAAVTIAAAIAPGDGVGLFGMVWNSDGYIYVGQLGSVMRVSANGGKLDSILTLNGNESAHRPQLLPDSDILVFTLSTAGASSGFEGWDKGQIVAQSLKTGTRNVLIDGGSDGRYLPTGHLVYALGNSVLAAPFDVKTLQVGGSVPVLEGVKRSTSAGGGGADAQISVADNGAMIYVPGGQTAAAELTLTLVDPSGARKLLSPPIAPYISPRISPDGKRFAVHTDNGTDVAVWIGDLNDATPIHKLTFEGRNGDVLWSPDSQRVAFVSDRGANGNFGILSQRVDGGPAERIGTPEPGSRPQLDSWSPDGKTLLFSSRVGVAPGGIYSLAVGGEQKPQLVVKAPATNAALSPDGRWLAYQSTETGGNQIYVQPFPPTGEKHQVTTEGLSSFSPLWTRDGHRVYFLRTASAARRQLMAVDVRTTPAFTVAKAVQIAAPTFSVAGGRRPYDVTPDGKSFLLLLPKGEGGSDKLPPEQINVTLNWFEELKQRVPSK